MSPTQPVWAPSHHQIAAEVRAALARAGLSGNRAAMKLGWKQQHISRRLNGTVPFSASELYEIAQMLNVPMEQFFPPRAEVINVSTSPLRVAA